ncbi:hypothetical protein E2C01_102826 [Portunus trituberculatus]|uniref:Uncharacterized protein n=1 Tax=Portunus trituberculatus TaxID=210409 RepID=A0A5B7KJG2_PORTR|nr:hypothetical protein [Portunus trituberculatus]
MIGKLLTKVMTSMFLPPMDSRPGREGRGCLGGDREGRGAVMRDEIGKGGPRKQKIRSGDCEGCQGLQNRIRWSQH